MSVIIHSELALSHRVSPDFLEMAGQILEKAIERKEVPGAVMAAGRHNATLLEAVAGYAVDLPEQQTPMRADTLFDLASLSKVCATLPAILILLERGQLLLTDPLSRFFPAYNEGVKKQVTVRHLLTHTSGLPPGESLHHFPDRQSRWNRVSQLPLQNSPGAEVVYSDIGFMLLGRIVEIVSGAALDRFTRDWVFSPLGMLRTGYRPVDLQTSGAGLQPGAEGYAATEVQKETGLVTYGVVHDENAFSLGGVAGHAGLFADVADVAVYARAWLMQAGSLFLSKATQRLATSNATAGLNGFRGLGWCLRGDSFDHMGDTFSARSFGHTGFTGTSISIDPETGLWVVLLTNRVHYGRENDPARLRRMLHNCIAASVKDE